MGVGSCYLLEQLLCISTFGVHENRKSSNRKSQLILEVDTLPPYVLTISCTCACFWLPGTTDRLLVVVDALALAKQDVQNCSLEWILGRHSSEVYLQLWCYARAAYNLCHTFKGSFLHCRRLGSA